MTGCQDYMQQEMTELLFVDFQASVTAGHKLKKFIQVGQMKGSKRLTRTSKEECLGNQGPASTEAGPFSGMQPGTPGKATWLAFIS